ncbi:hypothetical protein ODZ84_22755 [Chryseobacterium fluminis]|uniref:hypothetical protein n=1 Tax=Chryseobacterium fluminis TaxID=2983606 RepID=UPI002256CD92|nr:hypothetical protein [Chryseobacterium sp. MMS21-Ot14]UZT97951.1 hypothetical protein ODZ84_22755 [Chryseobacterium sp. MMS21-Ot14]
MINFNIKEKNLISDALKYAKKSLMESDSGHVEFLNDIEEEMLKINILLSRTQIDTIVYYLNYLPQTEIYNKNDVSNLQYRLNRLSDLP